MAQGVVQVLVYKDHLETAALAETPGMAQLYLGLPQLLVTDSILVQGR